MDDIFPEEAAFALPDRDEVLERLYFDRAFGDIEELHVVMPVHDMECRIERQRSSVCRFADAVRKCFGGIRIFGFDIFARHGSTPSF